MIPKVQFYPGFTYIAVHSSDHLQNSGTLRYDVIRRNRVSETVIAEKLTYCELQALRDQAQAQGMKIW